ncbi:endonuclease/exonuclease/phosphatase family protein [Candidatus Roizmanbacteria bacterium]|nr:endonuclease/exonuclease/phosphatase family protein [Candidatus Roizmanbacteria bacterium]
MKFSLLTYNLLLNRATGELKEIISAHKPDLLCFQEINTDLSNLREIENHGYRLADFSNSFMRQGRVFGVATFYNPRVFSLSQTFSFDLPNSLYQIIMFILHNKKNPRTVLKTEFVAKKNGKKVTTYNIHLTPFATNSFRIKQIKNTLQDLHLARKSPVVIAGDFNFPYGRKKFEEIIRVYDLKEATNNVMFTLERKVLKFFSIKLKLDYILYKNMSAHKNEVIHVKHSDHFPILTKFEL